MNTSLKQKVIEIAKTSKKEVCGFFYATQFEVKIYECKNVSLNPEFEFEISTIDHLNCIKLGKIIGIYHSHPEGPSGFSEVDIDTAEESCLPFYMYDVKNDLWAEYIPSSYTVEIEGRPFYWGFDDCYGAARNYYRQKLGLYLKDYDRDYDFGATKSMAILENFEKEGFVKLNQNDDIRIHDALVFYCFRKYFFPCYFLQH